MGNGFMQFAPIITALSLTVDRNSSIYIEVSAAVIGGVMIKKADIDSNKLFNNYIYGRN